MTIHQLHAIKDFEGLFTDERFQALLIYLRKRRPQLEEGDPHNVILNSGRMQGWLECLEEADKAAQLPAQHSDTKLPVPYSTSRPGLRSETNTR